MLHPLGFMKPRCFFDPGSGSAYRFRVMGRIATLFGFVTGFFFMAVIGDVSSHEMKQASVKTPPPAAQSHAVNRPMQDDSENAQGDTKARDSEIEEAVASDASADSTAPPPLGNLFASKPETAHLKALAGVDLSAMKLSGRRFQQETPDGRKITFTVDAGIQTYVNRLFEQYEIPAAAAVLINSRTGRIIALSQENRFPDTPQTAEFAFSATAPAASVFKIVTAAALVDHGVPLEKETCYSGGSSKLKLQHLEDALPPNHDCINMTAALGRSVNAVFAKLSDRFLNRKILSEYAERFGFNHPIEFDVPIETSAAEIPEERLERARAAAGFWHTHLSPIHGAVIAQSLAQGGAMLRPYIVEKVADETGKEIYRATTQYVRHIVSKQTADQLKSALAYTTTKGTARKSFHTPDGRPILPGIAVAGKTGTLTGEKPYRAYTWFVGLAPLDKPEVAVSVLVVNTPKWRVKAPQLAALILKKYFDTDKRPRD